MSTPRLHQEQDLVRGGGKLGVIRVHICADPLLRMGIIQILEGTRFVVSNAPLRAVSTFSACDAPAPDLFIVDGNARPDAVPALAAELKAKTPSARVVVWADEFLPSMIYAGHVAGVDGFCLSTSGRDVLIHCMELVMLGEVIVPSGLILAFISRARNGSEHLPAHGRPVLKSAVPKRPFSRRELEVLGRLREGASNKIIARELNVTESTVKVHVKAILRKIGAGNRSQAAIWATYHLTAEAAMEASDDERLPNARKQPFNPS
ncbi:LuxR C-terminal-related transcriptional regulator [Microvirga pakistanensis]|uniref:LuxR C-terminal-related transcriptional regulator n=1 Tax=Microvirga pakistanensis TaxID=1682650 RepID=UPI00141B1DB0|nr:response regulator transcription factor [Microvirga pakistanensis]